MWIYFDWIITRYTEWSSQYRVKLEQDSMQSMQSVQSCESDFGSTAYKPFEIGENFDDEDHNACGKRKLYVLIPD